MSAARPLWPRIAELFAQGDEHIAALREGCTKWGHALAAEAALATSQPFPDQVRPGKGCNCVFGPRCESNRGCADEDQTMGVKCRRTGEIRKRAKWSFFHPWWSRGPAPRVVFYCGDCFEELKAAWGALIPGITQPPHASDFWRPSLMDHIKLTAIENSRHKQMKQPPADYGAAVPGYEFARMSHYTPGQRATVARYRQLRDSR